VRNKKRLLVVNYDFPPAGGAGIKRCLKFMKFLPKQGWDILVLTVKNGNHSLLDKTLLKEINPGVKIHRALTFESLFKNAPSQTICNVGSTIDKKTSFKQLHRKAYKYLGKIIRVPDSRVLWLPAAMIAAIKLSRSNKYDAIYATGPTFVNLIIGVLIKIISRKPLITDFRDAWIGDPMLQFDKKYLRKVHARLEKFVIHNSDRVISTNPFVTIDFQKRYGINSKFDTIYNGYDMDDYQIIKEYAPKNCNKFTVVYTGRLYGERTPKYFLKALQLALEEKPDMKSKTQVIFVGSCVKFLDGKYIEDYIEEAKLKDVVKLTGYISRKESLEYQMEAHVLLLIIGIVSKDKELTYGLSGKVFDYMLSGKHILTLANGGATREFIVKNKIGDIFYQEDLKGVKNSLIKAYKNWEEGIVTYSSNIQAYEEFDFHRLSIKLTDHLNEIIKI